MREAHKRINQLQAALNQRDKEVTVANLELSHNLELTEKMKRKKLVRIVAAITCKVLLTPYQSSVS